MRNGRIPTDRLGDVLDARHGEDRRSFEGSQLEGSLDLTPRMNQRPQVGALEPHAATEEQATGARLVCLSAGLVKVS